MNWCTQFDERPTGEAQAAASPPKVSPQSASAQSTKSPDSPSSRGPYPGRRQITAHVGHELFVQLKLHSAQSAIPMVRILEDALKTYLRASEAERQRQIGNG